jgi:hypothetical protein
VEGQPLQRAWIRIFRLPQKLREFSVLWALGSMLGTTQSVDMISSLRIDYGRVEVAVLNMDLLPNSINTVVIRDRLFSLPTQVEQLDVEEHHDNQMEVDDGNGVAGQGEEKKDDDFRDGKIGQFKEKVRKESGQLNRLVHQVANTLRRQ